MAAISAEVILKVATCPMGPNDADAGTVADYLRELLAELWRKVDGFSGKRPFGTSSWQYDVYVPLIKAGLVRGTLDADGYLEDVDEQAADALIQAVIARLTVAP